MDCSGDKPDEEGVQVLLFSDDEGRDLVVRGEQGSKTVLRRPCLCFQSVVCCPSRIHQRIQDRKYDARWKQTISCQIIFCSVLTPQWSEWSPCTKNRSRREISCLASGQTPESCPMEVEREECTSTSSGNFLWLFLWVWAMVQKIWMEKVDQILLTFIRHIGLEHGHRFKKIVHSKNFFFLGPVGGLIPKSVIFKYFPGICSMGLIFTHPCSFRRFCPGKISKNHTFWN